MPEIICAIKNVTKIYAHGIVANKDISLNVYRGETFGLLGPNAAGKTTLLRQIVGLSRPTSGRIYLGGRDIVADPEVIPTIVGYLPQSLRALRSYRTWDAVYFTGLLRGLQQSQAAAQTNTILERLQLTALKDREVDKLSGGQKQLVALASALIGYRPLLVLDEPTSNLDPRIRRQVWETLRQIQQEHSLTIILVTHSVLEAESILTRVALIDRGCVIAQGTPAELKAQVSAKVRLEFRLSHANGNMQSIGGIPVEPLPDGRWRIRVQKTDVSKVLDAIFREVAADVVEDFQIIMPSLEDVYITLTGSKLGISPHEEPANR